MKQKNNPRKKRPLLISFLFFGLALVIITIFGASLGIRRGEQLREATAVADLQSYLDDQYKLALIEMGTGELERARQRFEYIFIQDQEYKDAAEKWVEISLILNVTRTPTVIPPTITPVPTQDLRPQSELYDLARSYIVAQNWDQALETLSAMRKANPGYETVAVDGMIYTALRNRGVDKILKQSALEGGLYDFALAEQFAPIDRDAAIYRDWARLYLLGNAFWVAYPEIAANYYGQIAGAAPNLTDASGMSAYFRYWMSLVHIAEQLVAKEDWCGAATAYAVALNAGSSPAVKEDAAEINVKCLALTPSSTPSATETSTATPTATIDLTSVISATVILSATTETPISTPGGPSSTPIGSVTVTNTSIAPSVTDTPIVVDTPIDTPVSPPPDTDVPPADTPVPPSETDTPEPPSPTP